LTSTGTALPDPCANSISNDPEEAPALKRRYALLTESRVTILSMLLAHSSSTLNPVIRAASGLAKTMFPSGEMPRTASVI